MMMMMMMVTRQPWQKSLMAVDNGDWSRAELIHSEIRTPGSSDDKGSTLDSFDASTHRHADTDRQTVSDRDRQA